ncbi:MAG TPA: hypothetical protein VFQ88_07790 [Nevskiaceae bacterium]|nr:hypothetical protein [Nevskiaceae bacterium]
MNDLLQRVRKELRLYWRALRYLGPIDDMRPRHRAIAFATAIGAGFLLAIGLAVLAAWALTLESMTGAAVFVFVVLVDATLVTFVCRTAGDLRRLDLKGKEALVQWLETAADDRKAVVHRWFHECAHVTRDQAAFLQSCPTAAEVPERARRRADEAARAARYAANVAHRETVATAALRGEPAIKEVPHA